MLTALFTIFASSFVIALSGALMPGPLLTATISESSRHGFITGPLMIAGHALLELALVGAILLGLAPFFQRPEVFVATALGGIAILAWMAFGCSLLPALTLSRQADLMAAELPGQRHSDERANPSGSSAGDHRPGYILYSWRFGLRASSFLCRAYPRGSRLVFLVAATAGGGSHRPPFRPDAVRRLSRRVCRIMAYAGLQAERDPLTGPSGRRGRSGAARQDAGGRWRTGRRRRRRRFAGARRPAFRPGASSTGGSHQARPRRCASPRQAEVGQPSATGPMDHTWMARGAGVAAGAEGEMACVDATRPGTVTSGKRPRKTRRRHQGLLAGNAVP